MASLPARGHRRILHSTGPSLASLSSSLSSYTNTSSRTQWGPGALAGKAILALGKATLRGAEWVIISRRLVTIKAHLPYREDRLGNANNEMFMDRIVEDVLELSRPEIYPDSIRFQAMELVLAQIASGATMRLVRSLSGWEVDDLIPLMTEIIAICVFCQHGFPGRRLTDAYASGLPPGQHVLQPCITFLSEVATQTEATYEATLCSKFLDLVLMASRYPAFPLRTTCSMAFSRLANAPLQPEAWRAALDLYWPFTRPSSLETISSHINATSPQTWLLLQAQFLQHEIPQVLELVIPEKFPLYTGRSSEDIVYPTFKNFTISTGTALTSLQEVVTTGIVSSDAWWYLLQCVALGGSLVDTMVAFLCTHSHRNKVSLLSRIVYFLVPNTNEWRSRRMKLFLALTGLSLQHLVSRWSKFVIEMAEVDEKIRGALLDAVIIVILPLLTPELKSWAIYEDLFRRSHYFPLSSQRPKYSRETVRLISIVTEGGMAGVIGEPGSERSCEIAGVLEPIFVYCG